MKEIGLPMIAKPDNGVGAAATFKLETADDVNHFKEEWDHSTVYFFEKFVTSSEICTFRRFGRQRWKYCLFNDL